PTPGGGGAAALSGAIGCALGRMVAHLTIGRKKYAASEERMIRADEKLGTLEEAFLQLADRDEEAFQGFMDAMKLPKETEEEKAARSEAMSVALKEATDVPLAVMETALEAFPEVLSAALSGNKNAVSDAGAAANMLFCALETGAENVRINLASMKDEALKQAYESRMESAITRGRDALEEIREAVRARMSGN
ncbi:MAG: cyclodeaminase/cyclohydrolase family protein, partial [Lachnospiraceae bacterium]|nr:cyclodeaminase/cyclohydrolase family protein [Lachnospiraceae bacterium]